MSDTIAAVKLTMPQALRNKKIQKEGFKCTDLMILEPRGKYNGLFVELKIESPFLKDGSLSKTKHIQEQGKTISDLNAKGYKSTFCWSLEMFIDIVKEYMLNK